MLASAIGVFTRYGSSGRSKQVGLAGAISKASAALCELDGIRDRFAEQAVSLSNRVKDTVDAGGVVRLWVAHQQLRAKAHANALFSALFEETTTFVDTLGAMYVRLVPMEPAKRTHEFEAAVLQIPVLTRIRAFRSVNMQLRERSFGTDQLFADAAACAATAREFRDLQQTAQNLLAVNSTAGAPLASLNRTLRTELGRATSTVFGRLRAAFDRACEHGQLDLAVASVCSLELLDHETPNELLRERIFAVFVSDALEPEPDHTPSAALADFLGMFDQDERLIGLQSTICKLQESKHAVSRESASGLSVRLCHIAALVGALEGPVADCHFPPIFLLAASDVCSSAITSVLDGRGRLDVDQLATTASIVFEFNSQPPRAVDSTDIDLLACAVLDIATSPDTTTDRDRAVAVHRIVTDVLTAGGSGWIDVGRCANLLTKAASQLMAVLRVHRGDCNAEGTTWSVSATGSLALRVDVTPCEGRFGVAKPVMHPLSGLWEVPCPKILFAGKDTSPSASCTFPGRGFIEDSTNALGNLQLEVVVVGMPSMLEPRAGFHKVRTAVATIRSDDSTVDVVEEVSAEAAQQPPSANSVDVPAALTAFVSAAEIPIALCQFNPLDDVLKRGSALNPRKAITYKKVLRDPAAEFRHPDKKNGSASKAHFTDGLCTDLTCGDDADEAQLDYLELADINGDVTPKIPTRGILRGVYTEFVQRLPTDGADRAALMAKMPVLDGAPGDPPRIDVAGVLRRFVHEARIDVADPNLKALMRRCNQENSVARDTVALAKTPMTMAMACTPVQISPQEPSRGAVAPRGRPKIVLKGHVMRAESWWQDDVEVKIMYPRSVEVFANRQLASANSAGIFFNLELEHRLSADELAAGEACLLLEIPDAQEALQLKILTQDHGPIPAAGRAIAVVLEECGALQWNSFMRYYHRGSLTIRLHGPA